MRYFMMLVTLFGWGVLSVQAARAQTPSATNRTVNDLDYQCPSHEGTRTSDPRLRGC